ncbi:MAG: UDP-galactopyranose mutase [Prevotella sp.]|nr:UDP-galactopyranose mutase [Prevotella sp.]
MAKYDYLIVGAGLYGSTFAYCAKQQGKKCLVIDKRPQLGGNLYCENIANINVHKYGPHIFHTSNKKVWDFVNSIVEFNRFTESPVAIYKGKAYNLPFNMNTFSQMWGVITPDEAKKKIEEQRKEMEGKEITNLEEQAISLVGRDIYERLIKGYTEKQWGRKCTELPPFIIKRIPVRFVYDNNYFNDSYQGVPIGGYNKLINGLLENIDCQVNTNFFSNKKELKAIADNIVFTGRIDEFYDFRYGKLDYRTIRFETETLPTSNYQGLAQINYTDAEIPYTRIIEHKHFESFAAEIDKNPQTVISREYSVEWEEGMEPYYPINNDRNNQLYQQYEALAQQETNVIFGGRLAEYKYYDMAPIVEKVLKRFLFL